MERHPDFETLGFVTAAAEFPNDNPELHLGTRWLVPTPCAAPRPHVIGPTARAVSRGPALANVRAVAPAAVEHEVVAAAIDHDAATTPVTDVAAPTPAESDEDAHAEDQAFAQLVDALQKVALERGATRLASRLPTLLTEGRVRIAEHDSTWVERLTTADIATSRGSEVVLATRAAAELSTWRDLLTGKVSDFSSCVTTLDEWALDWMQRALDVRPDETSGLKRALRRHGVAAFGMRRAA